MRISSLLAVLVLTPVCAFAAETSVEQTGQKFDPNTIRVKAGDTIKFLNHDDVTHNINVIDSDGNAEDQGLQKPGETIAKAFAKAGTFQVKCQIHPKMKMAVTVN